MAKLYNFSNTMRDILIDHLDGRKIKITAPTGFGRETALRFKTTRTLIHYGYLKYTGEGRAGPVPITPTVTVITDDGRRALAKLLASWADVLDRAYQMNPAIAPRRSPPMDPEAALSLALAASARVVQTHKPAE
jgi:hypothetical protein